MAVVYSDSVKGVDGEKVMNLPKVGSVRIDKENKKVFLKVMPEVFTKTEYDKGTTEILNDDEEVIGTKDEREPLIESNPSNLQADIELGEDVFEAVMNAMYTATCEKLGIEDSTEY